MKDEGQQKKTAGVTISLGFDDGVEAFLLVQCLAALLPPCT